MLAINLTPHAITVYAEDGQTVLGSIPPSGFVARVEESTKPGLRIYLDGIGSVEVVDKSYGPVDWGTPDKTLDEWGHGVWFIVSSLVRERASGPVGRSDLLSPDTGPESVVRDEAGRILGVRRFVR